MTYYGEILSRYTRCGNNPRPSPPLSNEPFFFLSRDSHELQSSFILSHCPGCFSFSLSLRNAVVSFLFNPDCLPTTRLLFSPTSLQIYRPSSRSFAPLLHSIQRLPPPFALHIPLESYNPITETPWFAILSSLGVHPTRS